MTTMLYIEWRRLGEIGDLYVLPPARGRGVAHALVDAALAWCRDRGCSAVSVTIAPPRQAELDRFYSRLGFEATGRTMVVRRL